MYQNSLTDYKTNGWLKPGSLAEAAQKILIGESTELKEEDDVADRANHANSALMTLLDKAENEANDPDLKLAIQIAMDKLDDDRYQEELFDAIETRSSRNESTELKEEDDVADRANHANSALMTLLDKAEKSADPDLKLAIQIAIDNLDDDRYQEELFDAIEASASRK